MEMIWKRLGETPLEALERFRAERGITGNIPMTYAGRLDPMAEGKLLILVGEECKKKSQYLGLDKEYEVEVVFGFETDTYDALGLADARSQNATLAFVEIAALEKSCYPRTFEQEYPPYSSRTVDGVALHELARRDELPDEMPTKEVAIYSLEMLEKGTIGAKTLEQRILSSIASVKGDFRQNVICERWQEMLAEPIRAGASFQYVRLRVCCSSGTYMRSLAHELGQEAGIGAFALSIKRTKIGVI